MGITGSIDRTCKLWDVNNGQCMETLRGHSDEVLDVCFNSSGQRLVTASADRTAHVYNVMTGACISILIGHEGEISKVQFSPNGAKLITASSDCTCRLSRATATRSSPAPSTTRGTPSSPARRIIPAG